MRAMAHQITIEVHAAVFQITEKPSKHRRI